MSLQQIRFKGDESFDERLDRLTDRVNLIIRHLQNLDKMIVTSAPAQALKNAEQEIRKLYFRRYNQKAKQLRGSAENADGRKIWPQWGGKEMNLMKADVARFGVKTMALMIEYFFADQVQEVAAFSRYKQKAGYGYNIFHASIEKLQMFKARPHKPCEVCGAWNVHYEDCITLKEKKEQTQEDRVELERIREETGNIDLTGMFKDQLKKNREK
jgi:hypothetical protein